MKKLNITKEQFNRSRYFQNKYGKLEYVSESGKIYKTNKGKLLKFVQESQPESTASDYDDEEWDDEEEGRGNSKWVWKLYVTGKGGRSGANDRYHENECMRESKMAFEDVDECVNDMFNDFFDECDDESNDSLWGPLFYYPDSSTRLHYGEIDEQKPYNTTKITYYPIGGSENSYGIGKIVMEHDTADYKKWIWVVEKA